MWEQAQEQKRKSWDIVSLLTLTAFGGVVLPALSILVEATSHLCAGALFDPIPTTWHLLLVIFVPLAQLQVWQAVRRGSTERPVLLGLANAVAIGISIFYTIVYLPLLPIAFAALLALGLGLLPMAPLLSLISGLILRRQLRQIAAPSFAVRLSGLAVGVAVAFAGVVLVELPITLTRVGLQWAVSASPDERARGMRLLRRFGDRDYLLRASYRHTQATDLAGHLFSLRDPATPEQAREVYYRLTGETFNAKAPPTRSGGRWQLQEDFDFDPDRGGTTIAGKIKGLSLTNSRLDGSADADAGLAYIEWTLVFKNSSAQQQEARAEVQLPPGGVVSRLTLWVNGEEREAAFAVRGQVRQAYEQVVRQRRDPVLVTTAGSDRILVQCFPVPPSGGEMKIRFGVTSPLVLEDRSRGLLRLPHFLDRNFSLPDTIAHAVWLESKRPLQAESAGLQPEQPRESVYALRGVLNDAELSGPAGVLRLMRASEITEAWTRDPLNDGGLVRQSILESETRARSRVVLVVDTSLRMKAHAPEISEALKTLPPNVETKIVFADGNGVYEEGASHHNLSGSPQELSRQLAHASFDGGADNVPALLRAWDLASETGGGVIVWVHGPQPLLLHTLEELRQRWERRPEATILYSVQTESGPDRIAEGLDSVRLLEPVARLGSLRADLERLFNQLAGRTRQLEFVRTNEKHTTITPPDSPTVKETSSHLARLWAHDEVGRLIGGQEKDGTEKATQLAVRYQLVTPVSGAVVLETAEQYRQAGLRPVDQGTVPTIPEPEMVLLLAVVAAMLLWMLYRQKTALRRGARG